MQFREQLLITVVDKAVIGAIVLFAGYVLSRGLERFKSERALANEFAKQRIAKIADLWESLYKWEAEIIHLALGVQKQIFLVSDDRIAQAMESLTPTLVELSKEGANELAELIDGGRFWLGPALHARFREHHAAILNHLVLLLERPRQAKYDDFVKQLEATRQSIFDHLAAGAPGGNHNTSKRSGKSRKWW